MKVVMPTALPDVLSLRRETGADRWDEMWEGVLHMPPALNPDHQDLQFHLENWLREHWVSPTKGRVYHDVNLASPGGWPNRDYRIPDLVLLRPEMFHIQYKEHFEGPPTAVVEIHSPGDEAYEKLDFYARLGVPEAWVIERDSRRPQVYRLPEGESKGEYVTVEPGDEGWLAGPATGILLRAVEGNQLELQLADDPQTRRRVP